MRLAATVLAEQLVQRVVVKPHRARDREPRARRREAQVLADVAAVDQRVAVAALSVLPRVALEDVGEEHHGGGVLDGGRALERRARSRWSPGPFRRPTSACSSGWYA